MKSGQYVTHAAHRMRHARLRRLLRRTTVPPFSTRVRSRHRRKKPSGSPGSRRHTAPIGRAQFNLGRVAQALGAAARSIPVCPLAFAAETTRAPKAVGDGIGAVTEPPTSMLGTSWIQSSLSRVAHSAWVPRPEALSAPHPGLPGHRDVADPRGQAVRRDAAHHGPVAVAVQGPRASCRAGRAAWR